MPKVVPAASSMERSSSVRWLAALLLTSALLNAIPVWWGLPTRDRWAFDEMTPAFSASAQRWTALYPPGHRYLLSAVQAPVRALYRAGFLEGEASYYAQYLAGRLLTVLLGTLTVFLVYRVARAALLNRRTSLLAAALLALSPTFVYYSKTINLDVPYLFWFTVSLLFFVKALRKRKARDFMLFAAAGVYSFCTKDQAVFLYVMTPVALVGSLAVERTPGGGGALIRALPSALVDRRMLLAAAATLVTFFVIYQGVFGAFVFESHFNVILASKYETAQRSASAIAGYVWHIRQSIVNLWFMIGGPAVVAGAVGFLLILFSRPRRWLALSPLVLAVPYQIAMMVVFTHLDVDRHLLAVALVVVLFGGVALDRLLSSPRLPQSATKLAVTLILILAFARAASFDALMLDDPRYAAEVWIDQVEPGTKVIGLGNTTMLPRNIANVERPFQPEVDTVFGRIPTGAFHDCWTLRALDADFLVPAQPGLIEGPGINYEPVQRFVNRSANRLNKTSGASTNLDKIPREITVWGLAEKPCIERTEIGRLLADLADGKATWGPNTATAAIAVSKEPAYLGSQRVLVLRATRDLRTRGVDPVAVIVENRAAYARSFDLELGSWAPEDAYPFGVTIRGPAGADRHEVSEPGRTWVTLPPVPAETTELFVLSCDKEWIKSAKDPRLVGVRFSEYSGTQGDYRAFLRELQGVAEGRLDIDTAALVDFVLSGDAPSSQNADPDLAVAGLGANRSIAAFAAIAARNQLEVPRAVELNLALSSAEAAMPTVLVVGVEDERGSTPSGAARGTIRDLRLGVVPARGEQLFLVRRPAGAAGRAKLLDLRWRAAEDRAGLHRKLHELKGSADAERERFIREVRLGRYEGVAPYAGSGEGGTDLGLGLQNDGWIGAAQPAGLIIANNSAQPMDAEIRVSCPSVRSARGLEVFVDGGSGPVRSQVCAEPGPLRLDIGTIDGGRERLVLVWTDRLWGAGGSGSPRLGTRILKVGWKRVRGPENR